MKLQQKAEVAWLEHRDACRQCSNKKYHGIGHCCEKGEELSEARWQAYYTEQYNKRRANEHTS